MSFMPVCSRAIFAGLAAIGIALAAPAAMAAKVTICHKETRTLRVSENALPAHKAHGDFMGECGDIFGARLILSCGVNVSTHVVTAATWSQDLSTELETASLAPDENCAEALHLVNEAGCDQQNVFGTPEAQTYTFACPSADSVIP